jgi:hypothetical protein
MIISNRTRKKLIHEVKLEPWFNYKEEKKRGENGGF